MSAARAHGKKDCLNANRKNKQNQSNFAVKHLDDRIGTKCRIQGKNFTYLLDTGASTSLISERGLRRIQNVQLEAFRKGRLTTASGHKLEILGCVRVPIHIVDQTLDVTLTVIRGLEFEVIIGKDVIRLHSKLGPWWRDMLEECEHSEVEIVWDKKKDVAKALQHQPQRKRECRRQTSVKVQPQASLNRASCQVNVAVDTQEVDVEETRMVVQTCIGAVTEKSLADSIPNPEVEYEKAHQQLKQKLLIDEVLALPYFNKEFLLDTDACDTGVGAVPPQESKSEKEVLAGELANEEFGGAKHDDEDAMSRRTEANDIGDRQAVESIICSNSLSRADHDQTVAGTDTSTDQDTVRRGAKQKSWFKYRRKETDATIVNSTVFNNLQSSEHISHVSSHSRDKSFFFQKTAISIMKNI
jgi:hypothetical protein